MVNLDPGSLLGSLLVGSVGFVAMVYGKRQSRIPHMGVGLVMMIYPYFVPNVWLMLGIAIVLLGALWLMVRFGV